MFSVPTGKPGVLASYSAVAREVFFANRSFAQYLAGPLTIDGANSGCAINAPYDWLLSAGTLLGRISASGKYAPSILGLTSAAYSHVGGGSGTLSTDVNTARELVRRCGASGSFKLTGPATAGGTVASLSVLYSAVNLGTGAISISALASDVVAGSLIQPVDGSDVIVTLICDAWGKKVSDQLNSQRLDVFDAQLLAAGGTINTAMIVNYPSDVSLQRWIKSALKASCAGVNFSDDFV